MAHKIMIVGYGSTGKYVLDMLTRLPVLGDCDYYVISRAPKEEAEKRINLTLVSAGILGVYPKVKYICCDINDVQRMSDVIADAVPEIIAYTGRYVKGAKYGEFSYPNHIGYGVWTPMSAVLAAKLMYAVKQSGVKVRVINTSYGDAVSPLLATCGLAPYTSAGNLNHLIPRIARAYGMLTGTSPGCVDVSFVGSHYANTYISKEGAPKESPYLMNIAGNNIVSDRDIFRNCAIPTGSGQERNIMIASDVVKLIELMLDQSGRVHKIHVPGPLGKIGGYPVLFQNGMLSIDESCFSLEDMETVNRGSLRCDGIEQIDEDGLHFTEEVILKMKKVFDLDYPRTLALSECEEFATKIAKKLEG